MLSSTSSHSLATTVGVLLICALLSTPFVIPLAFRCLGSVLCRRSKGRRALLRARVELEEDAYRAHEARQSKSEDEEEWERVESYAAGQSRSSVTDENDWDGVIGFFHPFW
jgi:alpha-1,2-mannosyltransferase